MSSPHPPTSQGAGPTGQLEPAWNPGGRNRSYINKAGVRKLGVIGILLSPHPSPFLPESLFLNARAIARPCCTDGADFCFSCDASDEFCVRDVASLSITMEERIN